MSPTTTMDRRSFLVRTGALLGAAPLAEAGRRHAATVAAAPPLHDWAAVRALFRVDPKLLHFAGFFISSHPRPVREAIERYRDEIDADPFTTVHERRLEREAAVAAAAAAYLDVEAADLALTGSTTMGLGLVYNGLDLAPGDEILATDHDHYSDERSIELVARRRGAKIVRAPLYRTSRDATAAEIVESVAERLTPRTRVLTMIWVHSKTGLLLPVRKIADALAKHNGRRPPAERALLVLDAVHGLGAVPGTPRDLGCDVFVAGTHKWMFAPRGTGLVWARPEAWDRIAPAIPSFGPFGDRATRGGDHSPGGFHSFEHRWAVKEAFLLHEQIGKQRVYDRVRELNTRLRHGLAELRHVTLHTPKDDSLAAGICCFEVAGLTPEQVVERLWAAGVVASTSPYRPTYARLSAGLLNDETEVAKALAAVHALA
jgi:selenocysteine lyase/cysteine desulfurase